MKIYEIGTGYTPIPAQVAAATESVVEELTKVFLKQQQPVEIIDISAADRAENQLPIDEVKVPAVFTKSDVSLGLVHKLKRVIYSICLAGKLKVLLKGLDEPAVLHFHNQYNLFFFTKLVSQKLRSKAIIAYTNHNGLWSLPWENVRDTLKKRYFQEIEAMKRADLVFVLNHHTKQNVVRHLGVAEKRVIQINNGVNTALYAPLSGSDVAKIKERYHLSDKKVILQVGSVYENKGQVRSVQMLASLLKEHDDLVYAYAGGIVSEEYHAQLIKAAQDLGVADRVRYLGAVAPGKEMNEVYNLADLTVFVSEYEGFPLVCIESISVGVPVVIGSEIAIRLGDGCVVSSGDRLKQDVSDILYENKEKYIELTQSARKTAIDCYSWDSVARDYFVAFEQYIKGDHECLKN